MKHDKKAIPKGMAFAMISTEVSVIKKTKGYLMKYGLLTVN